MEMRAPDEQRSKKNRLTQRRKGAKRKRVRLLCAFASLRDSFCFPGVKLHCASFVCLAVMFLVAGNERDLRKSEKSVDRSSFSSFIHRFRKFSQIIPSPTPRSNPPNPRT